MVLLVLLHMLYRNILPHNYHYCQLYLLFLLLHLYHSNIHYFLLLLLLVVLIHHIYSNVTFILCIVSFILSLMNKPYVLILPFQLLKFVIHAKIFNSIMNWYFISSFFTFKICYFASTFRTFKHNKFLFIQRFIHSYYIILSIRIQNLSTKSNVIILNH